MIRYRVEGNTVKAEITDMRNDVINKLIRRLGVGNVTTNMMEAALMPKMVCGEAHCHPGDEFNLEIGKSVAAERVKQKYNNELRKAEKRVAKCFEAMFNSYGYFRKVTPKEEKYCKSSLELPKDVHNTLEEIKTDLYILKERNESLTAKIERFEKNFGYTIDDEEHMWDDIEDIEDIDGLEDMEEFDDLVEFDDSYGAEDEEEEEFEDFSYLD